MKKRSVGVKAKVGTQLLVREADNKLCTENEWG